MLAMFNADDLHAMREFWSTLQNGEIMVRGSVSWSPIGWEFSEYFVKKYPFLLDDEMLQTTNFWRAQRAEPPLKLTWSNNGFSNGLLEPERNF